MNTADKRAGLAGRWLRFVAGVLMMVITVGIFMTGYTPPGIAGEVLRHNRGMDIDASPLFYSEVEHMSALEEGVRQMRLSRRGGRTFFSKPVREDVTE